MPLTRRGFLAVAGATGVAAGVPQAASTAARMVHSGWRAAPARLVSAYGVCVHPSWANDPMYSQTDRWMEQLVELGVKQIRGMMVPNQASSRRTAALCRRYGIKWLMTVAPATWRLSPAATTDRINQIAADYADVVLGFEGVNEPNNVGSATWVDRTVAIQRAIWDARNAHRELADATVLSPSMHAVVEDKSSGAGYRALARANIGKLCDAAAVHSYPRGGEVTTGLAARLQLVDLAYAGKPVWLSETGWTTYSGSAGHRSTDERVAAAHGGAMPAEIAAHARVQKAFRYELLDDPGSSGNPEARFGLVRPDWSRKPEYDRVRAALTGK